MLLPEQSSYSPSKKYSDDVQDESNEDKDDDNDSDEDEV